MIKRGRDVAEAIGRPTGFPFIEDLGEMVATVARSLPTGSMHLV